MIYIVATGIRIAEHEALRRGLLRREWRYISRIDFRQQQLNGVWFDREKDELVELEGQVTPYESGLFNVLARMNFPLSYLNGD